MKIFKISAIIILCLITNLILKAQDIDSLENLLQNTTDTIQKMEILEQLSSSSMAKSPEKCKSYAFDLYELAVLNKNQEQQANAFYPTLSIRKSIPS